MQGISTLCRKEGKLVKPKTLSTLTIAFIPRHFTFLQVESRVQLTSCQLREVGFDLYLACIADLFIGRANVCFSSRNRNAKF